MGTRTIVSQLLPFPTHANHLTFSACNQHMYNQYKTKNIQCLCQGKTSREKSKKKMKANKIFVCMPGSSRSSTYFLCKMNKLITNYRTMYISGGRKDEYELKCKSLFFLIFFFSLFKNVHNFLFMPSGFGHRHPTWWSVVGHLGGVPSTVEWRG